MRRHWIDTAAVCVANSGIRLITSVCTARIDYRLQL